MAEEVERPSREEVAQAVAKVLGGGIYPIHRTYDDAGLEEESYVDFAVEVIDAIVSLAQARTPSQSHEPQRETDR